MPLPKPSDWDVYYDIKHFDEAVPNSVENLLSQELLNEALTVGSNALDLGCGTGELAYHLSLQGFKVTAVDFSKKALELVSIASSDICCLCQDFTKRLDLEKNLFSLILSSLSLHYSTLNEARSVLNDTWERLLKGGFYIIRINSISSIEGNPDNSVIELNGFLRKFYSRSECQELIKGLGEVKSFKECEYSLYNHPRFVWEIILQK